jgi:hypothetical protein
VVDALARACRSTCNARVQTVRKEMSEQFVGFDNPRLQGGFTRRRTPVAVKVAVNKAQTATNSLLGAIQGGESESKTLVDRVGLEPTTR